LVRLREESTDVAAGVARLQQLGVTSVIAHLSVVQANGQVEAFEQLVATVLRGDPLSGAGTPAGDNALAVKYQGYYIRETMLDDLVPSTANAVHNDARRLAADERANLLAWALGTATLALVTIGVALLVGRSSSKPLKDLAEYARAINDGHLDAEPSSSCGQGPRETRVMFGVLNELVANLHLLDAKTNALAHCDFDNPVLLEPLPGRLGQSLESSVAVLSGSIAERDELQGHLAHEATHDSLTGIPNRPAAIAAIGAAIHRAARTGGPVAVLFIDLNEFKAVNDSHGHAVGDEVLRQVATRLSVDLPTADFVARLGGDEFVVVAEGTLDIAHATDLARQVIDTISEPIEIAGHYIRVGAAVGVAMTRDGPDDPLRVLARADAAMNRAKQHEWSAIEIFDAALQQQMIAREDIESALTAALADPAGGGLQLHYQPVFEAMSGAIVGVEALVRWDRGQGLLRPDSFIPIAEMTSLIIDLDCWVLADATRQLVEWSTVAELAAIRAAVTSPAGICSVERSRTTSGQRSTRRGLIPSASPSRSPRPFWSTTSSVRRRSSKPCGRSGSRSPSTTSAPGTPPSPTSITCPSTPSRSIDHSSASSTSNAAARWCAWSPSSATRST
jgi:diguanylate cyclase (GGDEF)-like protein